MVLLRFHRYIQSFSNTNVDTSYNTFGGSKLSWFGIFLPSFCSTLQLYYGATYRLHSNRYIHLDNTRNKRFQRHQGQAQFNTYYLTVYHSHLLLLHPYMFWMRKLLNLIFLIVTISFRIDEIIEKTYVLFFVYYTI